MSDQPENLILVFLRRIDSAIGELRADVSELKIRMTVVETQLGQLAANEQSHHAVIMSRFDRLETRGERLERHADSLPV